jgi:hypothetical protein
MFSKHDPLAAALRAVHENHVTVTGTAYDGRPEFLIDQDPAWGLPNELLDDGYIRYDEDAPLPATVETTDKGKLALTALFGILPPPSPVDEPDTATNDSDGEADDDHHADSDDPHDDVTRSSGGDVCVQYFGFGPVLIDFVNDEKFRAIVRKHGFQIEIADAGILGADQPLLTPARLWLKDPSSGGWLAVLYDDEAESRLESSGFVEILQFMDDHSKEHFQSRLFLNVPKDEDNEDDEDDELYGEVAEGHPFYDREYDFTTGYYKEA